MLHHLLCGSQFVSINIRIFSEMPFNSEMSFNVEMAFNSEMKCIALGCATLFICVGWNGGALWKVAEGVVDHSLVQSPQSLYWFFQVL